MEILLNGVKVQVEEDWTILDAAKFYGVNIPTLCYFEGLSAYGACRLCTVEIKKGNIAERKRMIKDPLENRMNVWLYDCMDV